MNLRFGNCFSIHINSKNVFMMNFFKKKLFIYKLKMISQTREQITS